VLHLRIISPAPLTGRVRDLLAERGACTNLVVLPSAAHQPKGDVVLVDVAREAASEVLEELQDLGLKEQGSIAVEGVDLSLSQVADRAEAFAPGHGSDAVVWEDLVARTREDSSVTAAYLVFFAVATMLAGAAVLLDSAVLVVGAMIVGPEYGALAGICAGVALRHRAPVLRGVLALAVGFPVGMLATVLFTWLLSGLGLVSQDLLLKPRPQTQFIYLPDAMSFVVAFLAGIAGMLALTSARSAAVVGVLVSVTTIPAAGNAAVAVAFAVGERSGDARSALLDQASTSVEQLLLNLLGIVLAGIITLWLQQQLWRRVGAPARRRVMGADQ
jgi:uncharacterized hydrophobic protein (TIGR00271 family)